MYQGQHYSLAEAIGIICDRAKIGREAARTNVLVALKDGALIGEVYDSSWRGRGDPRGNPLQKQWRKPKPAEWQDLPVNFSLHESSGISPRTEIRLARSNVDRLWPAPTEPEKPTGPPGARSAPEGYVWLADAVAQLGPALFGDKWVPALSVLESLLIKTHQRPTGGIDLRSTGASAIPGGITYVNGLSDPTPPGVVADVTAAYNRRDVMLAQREMCEVWLDDHDLWGETNDELVCIPAQRLTDAMGAELPGAPQPVSLAGQDANGLSFPGGVTYLDIAYDPQIQEALQSNGGNLRAILRDTSAPAVEGETRIAALAPTAAAAAAAPGREETRGRKPGGYENKLAELLAIPEVQGPLVEMDQRGQAAEVRRQWGIRRFKAALPSKSKDDTALRDAIQRVLKRLRAKAG